MASVIRLCSRNMATSADVIKHVTVIGGGLMGSGIAQVRYFRYLALEISNKNRFQLCYYVIAALFVEAKTINTKICAFFLCGSS